MFSQIASVASAIIEAAAAISDAEWRSVTTEMASRTWS